MSNQSKIESVLFVASKPLLTKKIAAALKISDQEVLADLKNLQLKYNNPDSGIAILQNGDEWQMVASAENTDVSENFLKSEVSGELTKPQLETLTVVSYCGPITKPELDQIRGVNCGLILRNLMLRGLVKETEDDGHILPVYEITMDYLRHLGLNSLTELPNYAELHNHPYIAGLAKEE
ncbi:MAG TPA: SMC-Scp complex subunit ScpB [Candidatus Udaeobacter sp.]|nr:SMC-Scp complex subunit ScpB [Candidatus Udaeobacter sp.]